MAGLVEISTGQVNETGVEIEAGFGDFRQDSKILGRAPKFWGRWHRLWLAFVHFFISCSLFLLAKLRDQSLSIKWNLEVG